MIFQIIRGRPSGRELKRIVLEQTGLAKRQLNGHRASSIESIHNTRRCIKRSRAALQLLRPSSKRFYGRANRSLRDLGRMLSGYRDHDVMLTTVDKLLARDSSEQDRNELEKGVAAIREWAEGRRGQLATEFEPTVENFDSVMSKLRTRIRAREHEHLRARDLIRAVHENYVLIRPALGAAAAAERAELFHEARKIVQRVLNQSALLIQIDAAWARQRRPSLRRLAKDLGYHQDLCVLEGHLIEDGCELLQIDGVQAVLDLIRLEQVRMRSRIIAAGSGL